MTIEKMDTRHLRQSVMSKEANETEKFNETKT